MSLTQRKIIQPTGNKNKQRWQTLQQPTHGILRKLEGIQEKALRAIYDCDTASSYEKVLTAAGLPTLLNVQVYRTILRPSKTT